MGCHPQKVFPSMREDEEEDLIIKRTGKGETYIDEPLVLAGGEEIAGVAYKIEHVTVLKHAFGKETHS